MKNLSSPIITEVDYGKKSFDELQQEVGSDQNKRKLLVKFPTVYVVFSQNKKNQYEVYVGETNNIERRTFEHLHETRDDWLGLS